MSTQITSQFTDSLGDDALRSVYQREMLDRAEELLLAHRVATPHTINKAQGDTQKWRRYDKFAVATTALIEGVTPSGKSKTKTDLNAQLSQYGDYVVDSDWLLDTQPEDVKLVNAGLLGDQAGETKDKLMMNEFATQVTNKYYANAVAGTANIIVPPVITDWNKVIRDLGNARAKTYAPEVSATTKIGTGPIMRSFWCIITEDMFLSVRALTGFRMLAEYASSTAGVLGEMGALPQAGIRFLVVSKTAGYYESGIGASGTTVYQNDGANFDVHSAFVFGQNAVGSVGHSTNSMQMITHDRGSAGSADPLNQRATMGWKMADGREIMNDTWCAEVQGAVLL